MINEELEKATLETEKMENKDLIGFIKKEHINNEKNILNMVIT